MMLEVHYGVWVWEEGEDELSDEERCVGEKGGGRLRDLIELVCRRPSSRSLFRQDIRQPACL